MLTEPCLKVDDVMEALNVSRDWAIDRLKKYPGVIVDTVQNEGRRAKSTIRIPRQVFERFIAERTIPSRETKWRHKAC